MTSQEVCLERYFLQYISLILIVVCMVVAIDHIPENPPLTGNPRPVHEPVREKHLTSEDFTDLFVQRSLEFREDRYAVLSTLLMSHEISAEIVFDFTPEHFELCVQQSTFLRRRLMADGVPTDAISVRIKMDGREGQILVTLKRRDE